MNYEFPRIVHISQVLEAIAGDEDMFYVVVKDGYTVINYKLPCNKTFPAVTDRNTAIRRELRGIKFDNETGEIVSRVFQKFFNAGEREETLLENVDITQPHIRYEKLDGSMVHPIRLGGGIRWCTKMGITDVSMQAETWIAARGDEGLANFVKECLDLDMTPIFEWCSRKQRIVLDYSEDRLVLTAVRHNHSGRYETPHALEDYAYLYDLDLVEGFGSVETLKEYVESIHNHDSSDLIEGEVIRFVTGHMLKIKTEAYVNLHRTKDKIQRERHFVAILLAQQLDDLKPFMIESDLAKAEAYEVKLTENFNRVKETIFKEVCSIENNNLSRKDFAINSTADPLIKQIIFHLWDKGFPMADCVDLLMVKLRDACEHEQKFERLRTTLLEGCDW